MSTSSTGIPKSPGISDPDIDFSPGESFNDTTLNEFFTDEAEVLPGTGVSWEGVAEDQVLAGEGTKEKSKHTYKGRNITGITGREYHNNYYRNNREKYKEKRRLSSIRFRQKKKQEHQKLQDELKMLQEKSAQQQIEIAMLTETERALGEELQKEKEHVSELSKRLEASNMEIHQMQCDLLT